MNNVAEQKRLGFYWTNFLERGLSLFGWLKNTGFKSG